MEEQKMYIKKYFQTKELQKYAYLLKFIHILWKLTIFTSAKIPYYYQNTELEKAVSSSSSSNSKEQYGKNLAIRPQEDLFCLHYRPIISSLSASNIPDALINARILVRNRPFISSLCNSSAPKIV